MLHAATASWLPLVELSGFRDKIWLVFTASLGVCKSVDWEIRLDGCGNRQSPLRQASVGSFPGHDNPQTAREYGIPMGSKWLMPQLFNTLSAFLASEARKISKPFFASGLVAE